MRVTIEYLAGGLLPHAGSRRSVSVEMTELPEDLSERANRWLSAERLSECASKTVSNGAADQRQIEFELCNEDVIERYLVHESACEPDLLELLDELFAMQLV